MKPIRLFAAGLGVLAVQAAFATDRTAEPSETEPIGAIPIRKARGFPQPAEVAHHVGVAGLHIVAISGIALCVMTRRRKAVSKR